ncbi:hypothetical protein AHF37_08004, partial [Paragonimus kellicotti]
QNQNCHRRLAPAFLSNRNLLRSLFRTLRCTLRITSGLSFLELQNLPLSSVDMACLCAGISKNRTIRHLSFEGSPIGDSGLLDLCQAIRHAPEIATLNLTGCKISPRGVDRLAALIRDATIDVSFIDVRLSVDHRQLQPNKNAKSPRYYDVKIANHFKALLR